MTRVVVLDTGPLGVITNPRPTPEVVACTTWLRSLLAAGARVVLPEIADYELRRELLRAGKRNGLRRLDTVITEILLQFGGLKRFHRLPGLAQIRLGLVGL